jgi:hypothetical protein
MTDYLYVAGFRDHTLIPSDEDYEWPACLRVAAADGAAALAWGDHLAARYCGSRAECEFLRSYLDPDAIGIEQLPRVACGEEASDEFIGW